MRTHTFGMVVHRAEVDFDSYNFVIRRDGTREMHVVFTDAAPHAKAFNGTTVGVAFEGDFAQAEPGRNSRLTSEQFDAGVDLYVDLCWWFGQLWIKGHSELGPTATSFPDKLSYSPDRSCPGKNFDLDKFRQSCAVAVCKTK